jgi:hypothetical protein
MAKNSRTNFWDVAGKFFIGGIILLIVLTLIGVGAWLIVRGQNLRAAEMVCPECPDLEPEIVYKEVPVYVESEADDYVCNAVMIGGPVESEGQCSFCTINYSKPGEVYIAGAEPIQYNDGAWVFQYNSAEDYDDFVDCINGQDFITDPSLGYVPVWP